MSNENKAIAESGIPVDVTIHNDAGKVYDSNVTPYNQVNSWVDWNDDDYANYAIALTDKGGDLHIGDFPVEIITAGTYVRIYRQRGSAEAEPARSDTRISVSEIEWSGTQEVVADNNLLTKAAKVLTNKAIQNKSTGAVQYFDDDGITPILTQTPTESESQLVRTPG